MGGDPYEKLRLAQGGVLRPAGRLLWSGEHWIAALNRDESDRPEAWFSLYVTRYSPAGEGAALHFFSRERGVELIAAEHVELGGFIRSRFFARSTQPPDGRLAERPAHFRRESDLRVAAGWSVNCDGVELAAEWQALGPPEVAYGAFREGATHFTALCFSDRVTIALDGEVLAGSPFPRDLWVPSLGAPRSSCVVAVAESLIALE